MPVAFAQNTRDEVREIGGNIAGALPAQPGMKQQTYVATAYRTSGNCGVTEQGDKTAALNCATDPTQNIVAMTLNAKNGKRYDAESETFVTHTLRGEGHDASEDGTGRGTPIIPIDMRQASRGGKMTNNRKEGTSGGAPGTGIGKSGDPSPTLSDLHTPAIGGSFGVRRLLPVECERLQGFPDGWTEGFADSCRYRMLGNAVSVPVGEWIGRRIVAASQ